jgi:hypothetical protein
MGSSTAIIAELALLDMTQHIWAERFGSPPHMRQFCCSMGLEETYNLVHVTEVASPSENIFR